MSKSLAMLTYESLGDVKFVSLVEKLNDEQINNLFNDSSYVHPEDMYKEGAVYIVVEVGEERPGSVFIFEDEYRFYYHKHRMSQEFDFFCLGNTGVDLSGLESGTRVEVYENDGRVQIGVGFKAPMSDLWIITGMERKLTDDGLAGMIEDSAEDVTYRFFDADGEEINVEGVK